MHWPCVRYYANVHTTHNSMHTMWILPFWNRIFTIKMWVESRFNLTEKLRPIKSKANSPPKIQIPVVYAMQDGQDLKHHWHCPIFILQALSGQNDKRYETRNQTWQNRFSFVYSQNRRIFYIVWPNDERRILDYEYVSGS